MKIVVYVHQTNPLGRPGDFVTLETGDHPHLPRWIEDGVVEYVRDEEPSPPPESDE